MPGFFQYEEYMLRSLIERLNYDQMSPVYKKKYDELDDHLQADIFNTKQLLKEAQKRLQDIDLYMTNNMNLNEFEESTKKWSNNLRINR